METASMHLQKGQAREAVGILESLTRSDDRNTEAWLMLAAAHARLGNPESVVQCCRRVIDLDPDNAPAHYNLGIALQQTGSPDESATSLRRASELIPDRPEIHFYLGNAMMQLQQFAEAANCFRRVVTLKPGHAPSYNSLGAALLHLRDYSGAVSASREAIRLAPRYAEAHTTLGAAQAELNQHENAIGSLYTAISLNPELASAHYNLGNILVALDRHTEAVEQYQTALKIQPDLPDAHGNLANALGFQGNIRAALATYKQALELNPNDVISHSSMLQSMLYDPATTPELLYNEHKRWNRIHCRPLDVISHTPDPAAADRPLRIGYVSPDFRTHSVAWFIEPVLAAHSSENFKIHCYYNNYSTDSTTKRLKKLPDSWLDVAGLSDEAMAQKIRDDRIDILVDLAGHTAGNRLLVFARKPAPVQVSWLGYPCTTGLDTVDYRLTDAIADPAGHEKYYTEKLYRLPEGFLCYQPPLASSDTAPPPSLEAGYPVFGSFNMLSKVTPEVVEVWADILRTVPDSRLLIKNNSFRDQWTAEHYLELFEHHGADRQRIDIIPWVSSLRAHLDLYKRIDIALDTFPYNGTTTTFEALWMGIPVITLAGDRHAGRVGASLLHATGYSELIASTPGEYIGLASTLAGDPERLFSYHAKLRSRLLESHLCDTNTFTSKLEAAYRVMWKNWCRSA